MTSLASLAADVEKIVIPLLKQILEKLNNTDAGSTKDIVEAAAAKVISDINKTIKECPCNKEILEAISKPEERDKQIVSADESQQKPQRKMLYSWPNDSVGNENLGTGKNEKSLVWPPERKK